MSTSPPAGSYIMVVLTASKMDHPTPKLFSADLRMAIAAGAHKGTLCKGRVFFKSDPAEEVQIKARFNQLGSPLRSLRGAETAIKGMVGALLRVDLSYTPEGWQRVRVHDCVGRDNPNKYNLE